MPAGVLARPCGLLIATALHVGDPVCPLAELGQGGAALRVCLPPGARMRLKVSLAVRFYIDPVTGRPHIHNHHASEDEVIDVLEKPGEDRPGRKGSRIALGLTSAGRYLRVVYVMDPGLDSIFVITA